MKKKRKRLLAERMAVRLLSRGATCVAKAYVSLSPSQQAWKNKHNIVRFAIFQLLYTAPKSSIWLQATSTHGAGLPYVPNETFPSRSLLYQKKLRPGYGLQQESAVSCALQLFALQKFSADLSQEEEGAIAVEEVEVSHE